MMYYIKAFFDFLVLFLTFVAICFWGVYVGTMYDVLGLDLFTSGELSLGFMFSLVLSYIIFNYTKGRLFVFRTDTRDNESIEYLKQLEKMTNELNEKDLNKVRDEFKNYNLYNMILSITNSVPEMIWMKDINGRYQFANKQLSKGLYGIDNPDDCIGKTDYELGEIAKENGLNVDFVEKCIASDKLVLEKKELIQLQESGISSDGYMYLDVSKTPFYENGELVGIVGVGKNITDTVNKIKALTTKDQVLETIGYASEMFLKNKHWREHFDKILKTIGETLVCERVYVYKKTIDNNFIIRSFWGNKKLSDKLNIKETLPRWFETLSINRPIRGLTKFFPDNERSYINQFGVESVLLLPIFVGECFWGFIGFDDYDEREWTDIEVKALRTFSNVIGAAIENTNRIKELNNKEETFRTIFNTSQIGFILLDKETRELIDINDTARNIIGDGCPCCESDLSFIDNDKCSCCKDRSCLKSVKPITVNDKECILISFIDISDKEEISTVIEKHDEHYKKFIERFNGIMFKCKIPSLEIEYIGPRINEHIDIRYNNIEKDLINYIPEYHKNKFIDIINELKNGIVRHDIDFKIINKFGEEIWFEQINNTIYDSDDNIIGIEGIIRNITRRRKSEIELANKNTFMQTLLDTLPIPFYFKDVNGVYKITNKEFDRLCGRCIVGETLDETFTDENREFFTQKDIELYTSETGYQTYEHIFKFPQDISNKTIKFYRSVLKDSNNIILGLIGVNLNMTDLYDAQNKLETIFQTALNPIFVKNKYGEYTMYNDSFKKMAKIESAVNFDSDLFTPECVKEMREKDAIVFGGENDITYDTVLTLIKEQDKPRQCIIKKSRIPGTELLTGSIKDLTKERRLIEELTFRDFVSTSAIDVMNNIIYVVDTNLMVLHYNKAFEKWCKPNGDIKGQYLFSNFLFISNNIRNEYYTVIKSKEMLETEDKLIYNDKEIKFDSRKIPILDDNGDVKLIITITKIHKEDENGCR